MNCPKCGAEVSGAATFCEFCGAELSAQPKQTPVQPQPQQTAEQPKKEKPRNPALGAVGAFVGALIGAAVIVILGQIGIVAAFAGLVLAVCTVKGYELLGGKLNVVGVIICLALMLLTPYFAYQIDWAIYLSGELGTSFSTAFENISFYNDMGLLENYTKNLVMLYGFTLLGGFATMWDTIKSLKK